MLYAAYVDRPVHRRDGIVSHVVADPDTAVEQFDGQMFGMTVVQQNPVFLRRREHDGDVRLGFRPQRFQFDERRVVHETQAGQVFATFACDTDKREKRVISLRYGVLRAKSIYS